MTPLTDYCNANRMPHFTHNEVLHVFVPIGRASTKQPPRELNDMEFDPQMFYQLVAIDTGMFVDVSAIKRREQWEAIYQAAAIPCTRTNISSAAIEFIEECMKHYAYKPEGGVHRTARTCTLPETAK